MYRYWLCCFLNDPEEALKQTLTFNLQFNEPLRRSTRSAEKAYYARNNEEANRIAREKGYPGAGYNISNKKLIEWLDITEDEQRHLSTIIDANEKRRRKQKRREMGVKSREEYLKEQRNKTDKNLEKLRQAIELNPDFSNYKLAKLLGISESYVRKGCYMLFTGTDDLIKNEDRSIKEHDVLYSRIKPLSSQKMEGLVVYFQPH
ncbi:hypothetical protein FB379_14216 [Aeribacillus composti]|nr:hypothetical protein FB379_14216 [Aeribacillus composti]